MLRVRVTRGAVKAILSGKGGRRVGRKSKWKTEGTKKGEKSAQP